MKPNGTLGVPCEWIVAGRQCKCWAVPPLINGIPYCRQHGEKLLRAAAKSESTTQVREKAAGERRK